MDNKKKIEIPFGAFDSELIRQEISIPNGFKAVIDGNKIILTRIESKDETIRKILIHFFSRPEITSLEYWEGISNKEALAWLEKQDPKKHEEELEKAYKTADKVQYRRGYEAATKEMEKQGEQKPAVEMKTPEESLGVDSETYSKIMDECIYDEQKPAWSEEVDLKKEFDDYTKDITVYDIRFEPFTHLYNCARHFFELGLKARKGE